MRLIAAIGDLRKQMQRAVAAGESAVRYGVAEATESLKMRLRYQTRAAGLGGRLSQTWRSNVKPKGPSFNSDGMVWSKVPHIMRSHAYNTVIRSKRAKGHMAIPTSAAGRGARGARITPAQWERRNGVKLIFVTRPGKNPILIADRVTGFRKSGAARVSKAKKPRKTTVETIFTLVPIVKLVKRMDIEGATQAEIKLLPGYIADRWRKAA